MEEKSISYRCEFREFDWTVDDPFPILSKKALLKRIPNLIISVSKQIVLGLIYSSQFHILLSLTEVVFSFAQTESRIIYILSSRRRLWLFCMKWEMWHEEFFTFTIHSWSENGTRKAADALKNK